MSDQPINVYGKLEAFGIKGMEGTRWRKTFDNAKQLNKWVEENHAEIHGIREVEPA
jgi:hypothetical protein